MNPIKINVNDSVTSKLSFEPIAQYDNMCLGYLTKVTFSKSKSEDDAKWEFAGMDVPRITFEFTQRVDAYNTKERFLVHSELPISLTKSNGELMADSTIEMKYIEMWRRLKHIHDQYASAPNFKALNIDPTFNPNLDVASRLKEFEVFFEAFAKAFEVGTDDKPIYLPYGGVKNEKLLVMKLIASGQNMSYLALPSFVGKGFVENAVFLNGKLDTSLRFTAKETPILTKVPVQTGATQIQSPVNENLTAEIHNLLKQQG